MQLRCNNGNRKATASRSTMIEVIPNSGDFEFGGRRTPNRAHANEISILRLMQYFPLLPLTVEALHRENLKSTRCGFEKLDVVLYTILILIIALSGITTTPPCLKTPWPTEVQSSQYESHFHFSFERQDHDEVLALSPAKNSSYSTAE